MCVARPEGHRVSVWSSTQTPFGVRLQLAEMLGRPQSSIRVLVPPIGGAYGSKGHAKIEIALATGKKAHDKRQSIKDRDWQRQRSRLLARR